MGRQVDVDDLVSTKEIAARLGLASHRLVHDWRRRYADFPEPVRELGIGNVWAWPDIEAWARSTRRL